MNLKKIFYYEQVSGLLLLGFPILCYFVIISETILYTADVLFILFFLIAVNFFQGRKQNHAEEKWEVINIAWAISGVIAAALLGLEFIYGDKLRTYSGESIKQYLTISIIPLWLIFHSIAGLILLSSGWAEKSISDFRKSIIEFYNSDSYVPINKSFFVLIILIGIFFIGFDYYQFLINRLLTIVIPLVMIVQVYDYKSKVKNKQKRKFDEQERSLLYKTISIATYFFIILLSIVYMVGKDKLFGHTINEMWGMFIFPLFFILWGVIGLVMLKKEIVKSN